MKRTARLPRFLVAASAAALVLGSLTAPVAQAIDQNPGGVFGWGSNANLQVGQNERKSYDGSIQICISGNCGASTTFAGVKAVAAGYAHSLALTDNGEVWAWGYNGYGQLGIGDDLKDQLPRHVCSATAGCGELAYAKAVAAGTYHSLAVLRNGSVATWGYNGYGQLGTGDTLNKNVPRTVCRGDSTAECAGTDRRGARAVSGGYGHSVALLHDGTLLTWGYNGYGQLGTGDLITRYTPTKLAKETLGGHQATAIAAGAYHTTALLDDGRIATWGYNGYGQLGIGRAGGNYTSPQFIGIPGKKVTRIAAGEYFTLALTEDGLVYGWGQNNMSQTGRNSNGANVLTPTPIPELSEVNVIAAGRDHGLAAAEDGLVYSWGSNSNSKLGRGNVGSSQSSPGVVGVYGNGNIDSFMGMTTLAGGAEHSLAGRDITTRAIHPNGDETLALEIRDGKAVLAPTDNSREQQRWDLELLGNGRYRITSPDGKCLTGSGGTVTLSSCNNSAGQIWSLDIGGIGTVSTSAGCLNVAGGALTAGASVIVYSCVNPGPNEMWTFELTGA